MTTDPLTFTGADLVDWGARVDADLAKLRAQYQPTLIKGRAYDVPALIQSFSGWMGGDGDFQGYNLHDYFEDGIYLGPDDYGVEPRFFTTQEAQP